MEDCEQLLRFIDAQMKRDNMDTDVFSPKSIFVDTDFTLNGPFDRLRVDQAFSRYSPVSLEQSLQEV